MTTPPGPGPDEPSVPPRPSNSLGIHRIHPGASYTTEQSVILAAAGRYRSAHQLRFLTILDMVEVLRGLGWSPPKRKRGPKPGNPPPA